MSATKLFIVFLSLAITVDCEHAGYNYGSTEGIPLSTLGYNGDTGYQSGLDGLLASPSLGDTYHKEFFTFSAPEEDFDDSQAIQQLSAAVKKNVRVIFIKAPENRAIEQAALAVAKQSLHDKTAIYVLNKQADFGELASKLTVVRDQLNHKPQVHFVKYRTPEEAAHAQQSIQSQYDILQGTTQNSNGGVAPVLNFASKTQLPLPLSFAGGYGGGYGSVGPLNNNFGLGGHESNAGGIGGGIDVGLGAYASGSIHGGIGGGLGPYSGGNGAPTYFGYSNNVQSYSSTDNIVSQINAALATGDKLEFPSPASPNAYLPPAKKT